ncbi:MAG: hypothetical protein GY925_16315 [Actinomycetia bacterium]|nr:hypothetical protein [Actinomycetes bacterium]
MEWVEIAASSIEEAKELALDRLGVTASELEVQVVEEASSSLFGLRRSDARIRARVIPTKPPAKAGEGGRDSERRRAKKRSEKGDRQRKTGKSGGGSSANKQGQTKQTQARKPRGEKPGKQKPTGQQAAKQRDQKDSTGRGNKRADTGRTSSKAEAATSASSDGVVRRRRRGAGPSGPEGMARQRPDVEPDNGVSADVAPTGERTPTVPSLDIEATGASAADTTRSRRIRRLDQNNSSETTKDKDHKMSEEVSLEEQGSLVTSFLDGVVESFGLTGKAEVTSIEDEWIDVSIQGDDLGVLIGPGGKTVFALAEVAKTALQRHVGDGRRGRVRVDVAGYREFRRAALIEFATEQAAAVVDSGSGRALESMGSVDRKIVHDAIVEVEGVSSRSEGEEPRRRVVLLPAD